MTGSSRQDGMVQVPSATRINSSGTTANSTSSGILAHHAMNRQSSRVAVIVSTYNNPIGLQKCLYGLKAQQGADFEIVVADDGSQSSTADVLRDPAFSPLTIRHCWHADTGFRLSMSRNRAIASTAADLLIFLDGDCIPRADFVARHRACCPPGCFAAGARIDIPPAVHEQFTPDDILSNRIFDVAELASRDRRLARYRWRLSPNRWIQSAGNVLTWRYCVFAGANASAWREDILRINGFDEQYTGYGSEDRDLGARLKNSGVQPRYRKFSLMVLHLDHAKPYIDADKKRRNREVFKNRLRDGTQRIELGIDSVLSRQ